MKVNPAKSSGPVTCMIVCSGALSYFFGLYWLNNPDQTHSSTTLPYTNKFDCYANTEMDNSTLQNWGIKAYQNDTFTSYLSNANTGFSQNMTSYDPSFFRTNVT